MYIFITLEEVLVDSLPVFLWNKHVVYYDYKKEYIVLHLIIYSIGHYKTFIHPLK